MTRVSVPVSQLEFDVGGNTIWVHGPQGATVLRIKTRGRITIDEGCENACSHCDAIVTENLNFCVTSDAEMMGEA